MCHGQLQHAHTARPFRLRNARWSVLDDKKLSFLRNEQRTNTDLGILRWRARNTKRAPLLIHARRLENKTKKRTFNICSAYLTSNFWAGFRPEIEKNRNGDVSTRLKLKTLWSVRRRKTYAMTAWLAIGVTLQKLNDVLNRKTENTEHTQNLGTWPKAHTCTWTNRSYYSNFTKPSQHQSASIR